MARIANLILLALEARGLALTLRGRKWSSLMVFYTQLSNLMTVIASLLLVVFGQTSWVAALRYLSVCMLIMTFFVTACVLIPMGGSAKALLFTGNGLYHHLLCPVLSTASYLLLERHAGPAALPVLVTLAYGLVMLWLNWKRLADGPYPFFRVHQQSAAATVIWVLVLMAAMGAISVGVRAVAAVL